MVVDSLFPLRMTASVLVLLMMTTGCTSSSQATPPRGTGIVIFVDFSDSIRGETRALLEQDIKTRIIPSLSAGDRILIAPINDKTLTDFRPLLEATFPPKPEFNGWQDNVLSYNRRVKDIDTQVARLKKSIRDEVGHMFERGYSSQQTDIFSSLLIAQKLFHNEPRRKVLVLMSDMIEDYPPYRFQEISWSPATAPKILSELDARGLIPDLSGACVYVAGVSARSADIAESIGHFWQAYFQRTGADMDLSRYAHVLLHWPPSKACPLE